MVTLLVVVTMTGLVAGGIDTSMMAVPPIPCHVICWDDVSLRKLYRNDANGSANTDASWVAVSGTMGALLTAPGTVRTPVKLPYAVVN